MTQKLNIVLSDKYVVTGTTHDLVLSEKSISKQGKNAGQEVLTRVGHYSKFEHLVRELMHKEIIESEAQTLTELRDHIMQLSEKLAKAVESCQEK